MPANLRFADDVLLFSKSLSKLKDMLQDFKRGTEKVGLEIHPDKMKFHSNQDTRRQKEVVVNNIKVELLGKTRVPSISGNKYRSSNSKLKISKTDYVQHWAAFHKYRQNLIQDLTAYVTGCVCLTW